MAELGSTTDPLELVPGRVASVHADADTLRSRASQLKDAADALAQIRVPGWEGPQADRFSDALAARPKGWRRTADALEEAAAALTTYADVLAVAQGDAAHAIELWGVADPLTATAEQGHSTAVVDTGARSRQEAVDVLEHARAMVRRAGDEAADALSRIEVGAHGQASAGIGNLDADVGGPPGGYATAGVGIGKHGGGARAGSFVGAGYTTQTHEDGSWTAWSSSAGALGLGGSVSTAITIAAPDVVVALDDAMDFLTVRAAS